MDVEQEETRIITIFKTDGRVLRASIPVTAKVTFGPLMPGGRDPSYGNRNGEGMYLRVYKTQNQQLMVIPGVSSFIDNNVELEELVYDTKAGSHWVSADDKWWTQEKARTQKGKLNPQSEQPTQYATRTI